MLCLESDIYKEVKQKEILKAENEKCKHYKVRSWKVRDRMGKSNELISRLQELNKALSDELELVKTKERNMIMEEKRIRYERQEDLIDSEQLIDKFMMSLDELNSKVEENSKTNSTLLDENNTLREEFKQKLGQYQEQARISKEMIAKLTEVNVFREERN